MTSQTWAQANFALVEQAMNGARGTQLNVDRRNALEAFLAQGIPTPKDEEWRYSNFRELGDHQYALPDRSIAVSREEVEGLFSEQGARLVLINGAFSPELSTLSCDGAVTIEPLEGYLHGKGSDARVGKLFNTSRSLHQRSLVELNAALVQDGVAILVKKGAATPPVIEVLHLSTGDTQPTVHTPRLLLVVEDQAELSLLERFVAQGRSESFSCAVTEIVVGENARCDYYAVADQGVSTVHYHSVQGQVHRDAQLRTHLLPLGGKLSRNEVNVDLLGSNSHATINALTVLNGSQHVDNSTVMRHAVPHCESSQLFKGIYGESSRGVFQGTIIVEKDAQKTNAFQSNQSLLLSREASTDTKPQLKIWADDVKCTHGATVGQLDQDALFYIKSRGIGAEVAAALLTEAFAGEVLAGIRFDGLRSAVRERLFRKLGLPGQE